MKEFFKKALSVVTAMAMALSLMTGIPFSKLDLGITASAAESGSIGYHNWSVDDNGTLTIWGSKSLDTTVYKMAGNSLQSLAEWYYRCRDSITKVVIGEYVTSIGSYAFYDLPNLTSVTIPEDVTSIGNNAFHNCSNLTSVTIPASVTTIGNNAFYGCSNLTSVTFEENSALKSIGENAFKFCTNLKSITIPEEVTTIGANAFELCTNLASITIPASVTSIGTDAFYLIDNYANVDVPCSWNEKPLYNFADSNTILNYITVNIADHTTENGKCVCGSIFGTCGDNLKWSLVDDTLTISGTGDMAVFSSSAPAPWNSYKNEITNVVIENGVTSIDDYAFDGCTSLKTVNAPCGWNEAPLYTFGSGVTVSTAAHSGLAQSASGAVVSFTCPSCDNVIGTITLYAPAPTNLTYDGAAKTATITSTFYDIFTPKTISYCCDGGCINAGDHTASIKSEINTLETVTASVGFTITAKPLSNATAVQSNTLKYNGSAQTPEFTVTAGNTTLTADDYDVIVAAQTNPGDYTATIECKRNYSGTIKDVPWSIGKAAVTVTADDITIYVGGTPEFTYSVNGLVGDDILQPGVVVGGTYDNEVAREYPITLELEYTADDYYTYTAVNGTLTVSNKEEQTITASDVTLTYGETGKKVSATTDGGGAITYTAAPGTDVISVAADGTITALKPGTATVTINAAETDTYAAAAKTVTVTVNKAEVTVTADDITIYVGGTPEFTYSVEGLVGDDILQPGVAVGGTYDNEVADEYPITVEIDPSEDDYYIYTAVSGTLTVSNKEEQTITASDVTLTYGETGKKISATTDGGGAITYTAAPGTDVISVAADGTITALKPGTATVTINAAETDTYAAAAKTVTVTVNKAEVTVTADDITIYVGGTPEFTYSVKGLVGDDILMPALMVGGAYDNEIAGEYPITLELEYTADDYYTYTAVNGTLTITEKDVQTITADDVTLTYGETGKKISATSDGGAITYTAAPGTDVISVAADGTITALKHGTATVTINAAETDTYAATAKTVTVTVNKAAVTVTADDIAIYLGSTPEFTYSVKGLVGDDILQPGVAVGGTYDNEVAGEYPITVELDYTDDDYYTYTTVNGTLTITEKDVQTITADDVTLTYGETGKKVSATTDGGGAITYTAAPGTDVISVAADGTITALKPGTATVTINAAETDTYAATAKTITVTVNKAAVTVTADDIAIYLGSTPEFTYSVNGLVGDDILMPAVMVGGAYDNEIAGEYPITLELEYTEDDCYTYTAVNGTLTVKRKSTSGGGYRPTTPINPELNGKSMVWSTMVVEIAKLTYGSEVTIELNGNYDVPVEVIKAIAEKDAKVTFIVDSTRSWYLDGKEIDTPAAADLSILAIASLNADALRGEAGTKFRVDGTNIPTELKFTFAKKNADKFANLYKKDGDKLVFVDNAKIDADGNVMLSVSENGDYVVMICEYSDRKGDVSNDGVTNALDASAILKDIVELEDAANPVMLDYNGDGRVNAMDASAILKDIVNSII